jgi:hypothetical protein
MRGVAYVVATVALAVLTALAAAEEQQPDAPAQSAQELPTLDPTETVALTEAATEVAKVQTRAVLRDECPITGVPPGTEEAIALTGLAMSLFSAVLPRAIDKGVELATNYARQKGSDQETLADPSVVRISGFTPSTRAQRALPLPASAWWSGSARLASRWRRTSSRYGSARRQSSKR